jgi:hypothetical protein
MPDGKVGTFSNTLSKKKQSNCTICCDMFKMPKEIYSTHRGNSLKCPNSKNNMPSKNSQLDQLKVDSEQCTQNSTVAVVNNDEETAADNNDEETQTIIDINDSESDSDLSTYTNAHTYDKNSSKSINRK